MHHGVDGNDIEMYALGSDTKKSSTCPVHMRVIGMIHVKYTDIHTYGNV